MSDSMLKSIIYSIQNNELESALNLAESMLRDHPDNKGLLIQLIDIYRRLGMKEKCNYKTKHLISLTPNNLDAYIKLAQELYSAKQFDTALAVTEIAVIAQKRNIKLDNFRYMLIAQNYYRLSDAYANSLKRPIDYAIKLINDYPDSWAGYVYTARELSIMGKYKESKTCLLQALERFGSKFDLICALSDIYRLTGDRNESLKINHSLLKNYPKQWQGYYRVAQDLAILQNVEDAFNILERGTQEVPNNPNLLSLAIDLAALLNRQNQINFYTKTFCDTSKCTTLSSKSYASYRKIKLKKDYIVQTKSNGLNLIDGGSDIFILTGCSGSGKTSLLRCTQLDTQLLFSPKINGQQVCKISKDILNELDLISQLEKQRNSVSETYERAMLFGTYFPLAQFHNLLMEPYLPKSVVLHIDIRQLLFSRKISHLYNLRHYDFDHQNLINHGHWRLMEFFAHPVFRLFKNISITTVEPCFERNAKRFQGREGTKFFLGDKNPNEIYNEMYRQWFKFISNIRISSDNLIIEESDVYKIYDRNAVK